MKYHAMVLMMTMALSNDYHGWNFRDFWQQHHKQVKSHSGAKGAQ